MDANDLTGLTPWQSQVLSLCQQILGELNNLLGTQQQILATVVANANRLTAIENKLGV